MSRAPFQVLVFPYRLTKHGDLRYAIFKRADLGVWQGLAGGGEGTETPEDAARRESREEAGIPSTAPFLRLTSVGAIPAEQVDARQQWDPAVTAIPEYGFGVAVTSDQLALSKEHVEHAWLTYAEAASRLEWSSNRAALRELHSRLTGVDPRDLDSA